MITLYNIPISGNCHKIRLLLNFLAVPYQTHDIDLSLHEQKSPEFLQLNPFGQVPVLDDDGIVIRDSQAILVYLAKKYGGTRWWPEDAAELAQIIAWLSTAANEIAQGPSRLRVHHKFGRAIDVESAKATTNNILAIIDAHLSNRNWLVGEQITIADIAVYPYLALAHEGHIELRQYKHIAAWINRIETLPHYIAMPGIILTN